MEAAWHGVADAYDRSFATLCDGVADLVAARLGGLRPRGQVLDVGCGTGRLAHRLADEGLDVLALDPDPEMVEATRARLAGRGEVGTGALPRLDLSTGAVGGLVANFVLNHVDDPAAAAAECARVLAPGGPLFATVWPATPTPQALLWGEVLDEAGALRPEPQRLAPDLDYPRTPDGLGGLLTDAGIDVVEAGPVRWRWEVDADDFLAGATAVGTFGEVWRANDAATRERVRTVWSERTAGTRLGFDVEAVLVLGIR